MQTIYKIEEKYFCNLQRAMNYAEDLAKLRANRDMNFLKKNNNTDGKENIASHVKGAWRKSQKGLSYVVKWEQHHRKHSASAKLTFIKMERHAEWKNFE